MAAPEEQRWVDLCDPDDATLRAALPAEVHEVTRLRILKPPVSGDGPRPRLEPRGSYVFGVLSLPLLTDEGVVFQEVDVIATINRLFTVRKSPPGHLACNVDEARAVAFREELSVGMCLYSLIDEIAERFLDVIDRFDDAIDDLEDHVRDWPATDIRNRIGETRHDILHVRRALAPTRDAARAVLDDRVELDDDALFPRDVELHFADAYDKLLRATDGLDLARDLLAGVRDYHQAEVANDQNEVMKRLTAIASILLVPTFIVGVYGQNLHGGPEFGWSHGYLFSWGVIIAVTALQIWYFRRKQWL